MDLFHKHFEQQTVFQAPPEVVKQAVSAFLAASMVGWDVAPLSDGFEATRYGSTAKFHVSPAPAGATLAIEYLVARASGSGFMLVDIGGYYDRQIQKWLYAVWQELGRIWAEHPWQGVHTPEAPAEAAPPVIAPGTRVAIVDADGAAQLGAVARAEGDRVLIAFEKGDERWVPAHDAHVVR
jgi:hypothetical protein